MSACWLLVDIDDLERPGIGRLFGLALTLAGLALLKPLFGYAIAVVCIVSIGASFLPRLRFKGFQRWAAVQLPLFISFTIPIHLRVPDSEPVDVRFPGGILDDRGHQPTSTDSRSRQCDAVLYGVSRWQLPGRVDRTSRGCRDGADSALAGLSVPTADRRGCRRPVTSSGENVSNG